MRYLGSLLFLALVFAAPTAAANDPRVPPLQNRVAQLRSQIAVQQQQISQQAQQIATLQQAMTLNVNYDVCLTAVNFDIFHLFQKDIAILAGQPEPATTPLDDKGACAAIGLTRQPLTADPWLAAVNRGYAAFSLYTAWMAGHRF